MNKYLPFICLISIFHFSIAQKARYIPGAIFVKLKDNASSNIPVFKTASEFNNQRLAYLPDTKEQQIRVSFLTHKVVSSKKAFKPKSASSRLHKIYHIQLADSASTNLLMDELKQNPDIEYVEKIPLYEIFNIPNDLNPNQWNLTKIQAPQAWDLSMGVTTVVIAIVDDEVRLDHEDLAANIWVNPNEIAGNGIDDDGNGYTDDIHGYDVADNDNNPTSINTAFTHGTHCAGIAAASTNNNIGIASPSYKCKIMAVKTKSDADTDESSLPYAYDGLFYAIETKPNVISMSWGGYYYSTTYQLLIDEAYNKGIVLVAAAGNSNTSLPMYPASYNHVISVGATDQNDVRAFFSNYGTTVDIMSPGLNIYSTLATTSSSYGYLSGTSMACPLVAGVCALMLSYEPSASPDAIEACLKSGADNISSLNPGYENLIGAGRVNAFKSLNCLKGTPIADFSTTITSGCVGQSIVFSDKSFGAITAWNWTFTGGNPAFSTAQNPVVTYAATGSYPVTLRVQNAQGSDIKTKLSYITIIKPSATISGNATINQGQSTSLRVDFTGNAPYSFFYSDGTSTYPVNGVTNSPYYISVSPTASKSYSLSSFSDNNCSGSKSGLATIIVTSVTGPDLNNGLVAYYPFDGNANDQTGSGNNGTVSSGNYNDNDRNCIYQKTVSLSGINSGVNYTWDGTIGNGKQSFSIGLWFKTDKNSTRLISNGLNGAQSGYSIGLESSNRIWFGLGDETQLDNTNSSTSANIYTISTSYNDSQWHFVTVVVDRSANRIRLYLDGTKANSTKTPTYGGTITNNELDISSIPNISSKSSFPLCIGSLDKGSEYFRGDIDEVRIYNRVLTDAEVASLYSTPLQCNSGLVASYPFCGNANDVSGNGNNGTVSGATLTTDRFGNANSAYSFNGVYETYIKTPLLQNYIGDFTMSAWVLSKSSSQNALVFYNGNSGANGYGLQVAQNIYCNTNQSIAVLLGNTNCNATNSNYILPLNTWVHVALTNSADTLKVFINGFLNSSSKSTYYLPNGNGVIGGWPASSYSFIGVLDDLKFYNRKLSNSDILALYNAPAPCTTTGLVADYPFCGNANDVSGNGNNGTISGTTLTTDRFGNANSAYQFNGINNTITFSGVPTNNTDNWAISAWINPSSLSQAGMAVSMGYDDTNILALANGYAFGMGNGNGTSFYNGLNLMALYCNISFYNTYYTLNANTWYHVVMQRELGSQSFYVNGVLLGFNNYTTPYPPTSFTIGSQNGIRYFNGKVDDVKIYNKALTVTEITSLYNAPAPCTSTGLVASYPFCGNANDVSGNGNNGTVLGASLTADRFGNVNSAYYFPRTDENYILAPAIYNSKKFSLSFWYKAASDNLSIENPVFCSFKTDLTEDYNASFVSELYGTGYISQDVGKINSCSYTSSNVQTCLQSNQKPQLEQWHHIVYLFDATQYVKLYIDGVFESSTTINGNVQKDYNYFFMGRETLLPSSTNTKFHGILDDFKIYDRVIGETEISQLYNEPAPCTCSGITTSIGAAFSTVGTICGNTYFNVINSSTGPASATYYWSFGSDASPSEFYGYTPPKVFYQNSGLKNIKLKVTGQCGAVDSVIHPVSVFPTPVAYAGPDIDLCTFADTTLGTTAVSGYHYQWSPGKYLSDSTVSNPVLAAPYIGNIIVKVNYGETTCIAYDTMQVFQYPTLMATKNPICQGDEVFIVATFPGIANVAGTSNLTWQPSSAILQNLGSVVKIAPDQDITISVSLNGKSGCKATTSLKIMVEKLYTIIPVYSPNPYCKGDSVRLTVANPVPDNQYTWKFYRDSSYTMNGVAVKYLYKSSAVTMVTDNSGCKNVAIINVDMLDLTFNTFYSPQVITECEDAVLVISSSLPGNKYLWSTGQTLPSISVKNSGTYTVVTYNNCFQQIDTIKVTIKKQEDRIPNVITPNKDGFNDVFTFDGCFAYDTDFTFTVFSRWGMKIYESAHYDLKWDADGISDGLYYYTLIDNKTGHKINGWLEIAR